MDIIQFDPKISDYRPVISERLKEEGICLLGKGEFPVTPFAMPEKTTLAGIGTGTLLWNFSEEKDTALIQMGFGCSVSNLTVRGKGCEKEFPEKTKKDFPEVMHTGFPYTEFCPKQWEPMGMDGISVRIEAEKEVATQVCRIENVNFFGLSRAGLHVEETGFFGLRSVMVTNCQFSHNGIGIFTDTYGEFGIYNGNVISMNYIGVYNNGGNNQFIGCGINGNQYGFYTTKAPNSAHGILSGSTVNHNDLGAVRMEDVAAGFLFETCHFAHNGDESHPSVVLKNTKNVGFTGCAFYGRVKNPLQIEITGREDGFQTLENRIHSCRFFQKPEWITDFRSILSETGNHYPDDGKI